MLPREYETVMSIGLISYVSVIHTHTMIFSTLLENRESPTLGGSTRLLSGMKENMIDNGGKVLTGFGIR
jgi:hypothetical protein